MIISKQHIEEYLGYELDFLKLKPLYENEECIGLQVFVKPKVTLEHIEIVFDIPNPYTRDNHIFPQDLLEKALLAIPKDKFNENNGE